MGPTLSRRWDVLLGSGLAGVEGVGIIPFHPGRWGPWSSRPQSRSPAPGLEGALLSQQMAEAEAMQLKEEGNQHFQLQDYKAATKSYSQALKLTKDKALLATLYRNRAACGLKTVWGGEGWGAEGWTGMRVRGQLPPPDSHACPPSAVSWNPQVGAGCLSLLSGTHRLTHSSGRRGSHPQRQFSSRGNWHQDRGFSEFISWHLNHRP